MSLVKHYECSGYALYKINIIIYILLYSFLVEKLRKSLTVTVHTASQVLNHSTNQCISFKLNIHTNKV